MQARPKFVRTKHQPYNKGEVMSKLVMNLEAQLAAMRATVAKVYKRDGEKTMTLASALSLPLKAGTVLHVSTPYSTNECRHLRVTADMGPLRKRKRAAELRGSSVGAMANYGGR